MAILELTDRDIQIIQASSLSAAELSHYHIKFTDPTAHLISFRTLLKNVNKNCIEFLEHEDKKWWQWWK